MQVILKISYIRTFFKFRLNRNSVYSSFLLDKFYCNRITTENIGFLQHPVLLLSKWFVLRILKV